MSAAIATSGLTKRFGSLTAVSSVDLEVQPGDVYGFLGPNGSGKTTTVRMLLGLVLPTSGTVEVLGAPIPRRSREVLHRVGALVESPAAYGHLPARTNLALLDAAGPGGSRRTRKARIDQALEQVGLAGVGRRPVKAYSLGMRQRLGIAAALLRRPELLILDEPTNGLDPQGIHEIRDLLLDLNAEGTTIFLSSHLLAEVELLCRRVGVVDRGRLVLQDTLASVKAPTGRVVLRTPDPEWAVGILDGEVGERDGDRIVVRSDDPAALNARLVGHGIRVTELVQERRSLEDVVLAATSAGSDRVDLGSGPARIDGARAGSGPGPIRPGGSGPGAGPALLDGSGTDVIEGPLAEPDPEPDRARDPEPEPDPDRAREPDPEPEPDPDPLPRRRPAEESA